MVLLLHHLLVTLVMVGNLPEKAFRQIHGDDYIITVLYVTCDVRTTHCLLFAIANSTAAAAPTAMDSRLGSVQGTLNACSLGMAAKW